MVEGRRAQFLADVPAWRMSGGYLKFSRPDPSLSLPLLGRPFGLSYSLTIVPSEHISKSPVGASDEIGREARRRGPWVQESFHRLKLTGRWGVERGRDERVLKTAPKGVVFCRLFTGTET
jgi:hypothetical protein